MLLDDLSRGVYCANLVGILNGDPEVETFRLLISWLVSSRDHHLHPTLDHELDLNHKNHSPYHNSIHMQKERSIC